MSEADDYSSALSASYGTSAFGLEEFSVKETPVIKEGFGRTSTLVEIELVGRIDAVTQADYQAKLIAVVKDFETDGRDFQVFGINGVAEFTLFAARCANGGPHVGFEVLPDAPPLQKRFKATIKTEKFVDGNSPSNSFKTITDTRADGLVVITTTGELIGPSTMNYFTNTLLPQKQSVWALPGWVLTFTTDAGADSGQTKTKYQFKAFQNFAPLPSDGTGLPGDPNENGTNVAVDGEITKKVVTDEQHQLITTYDFNLLIVGDAQVLLKKIRDTASNKGKILILRENYSLTTIREQRLTGGMTTLQSGDKDPLLKYTETVAMIASDAGWEEKTYPGAAAVVVHRPAGVGVVRQSGRATAVGKFYQPRPIYSTHLRRPEVTCTDINDVEKETSWSFEMYPSDGKANPVTPFGVDAIPKGGAAGFSGAHGLSRAATEKDYFG